jgi:hypothetical protein
MSFPILRHRSSPTSGIHCPWLQAAFVNLVQASKGGYGALFDGNGGQVIPPLHLAQWPHSDIHHHSDCNWWWGETQVDTSTCLPRGSCMCKRGKGAAEMLMRAQRVATFGRCEPICTTSARLPISSPLCYSCHGRWWYIHLKELVSSDKIFWEASHRRGSGYLGRCSVARMSVKNGVVRVGKHLICWELDPQFSASCRTIPMYGKWIVAESKSNTVAQTQKGPCCEFENEGQEL